MDVEAELLAPPQGASTSTSPECEGYVCRKVDFLISSSVADPDPGYGIRCLFDPWILDPESGMAKKGTGYGIRDGKNSEPGSRINLPDPQHWFNPSTSDILVYERQQIYQYCTV